MAFGFLNKSAWRIYRNPARIGAQRMFTSASFTEFKNQPQEFHNELNSIINSVTTSRCFAEAPSIAERMKEVLDYNLTGGKCIRGLTTVMAYEVFEKPENITEDTLKLSRALGWCVEMFQAYWLVLDDVIDRAETRREKPCWYSLPSVGLGAVNDSVLIQATMLDLLKTNFRHLPRYSDITNLFNEALLITSIGEHLDYTVSNQKERNYSLFTPEHYSLIVKYKSSYYSFYLPICLGMFLANRCDTEKMRRTQVIAEKMGFLFQMQDDFIDVFGSEAETGKTGRDIQEGKCSWLAVTALQHCNEAERKLFTTYYKNEDPSHVEKIKTLYKQLQLPQKYQIEESALHDEIVRLSHEFDEPARATKLFMALLDTIFKRRK